MRAALTLAAIALASSASAQERPLVDVSVGARAFSRHLAWHEDLYGRFAPYSLPVAPAVRAEVECYPLARAFRNALGDVGIVVSGEHAFAVTSQTPSGQERETTIRALSAGLRFRVPLPRVELGVSATWGLQQFVITPSGAPTGPFTPAITYQSVRAGLDARVVVVPRLALLAGLGGLYVLDTGELTDVYFPRATISALDARLGAAYTIIPRLEARVVVDGRRYFHAMNPEPGDRHIVGGALDHVFGVTVSAAWRM